MAHGKRILVVEDDEETLNVFARALAAGGYDVLWARNGKDALKLLTTLDHPLTLVITDVVLPGMSAPELVRKVNRRFPGTEAIYMSAFDRETVRSHGVDPDTAPFLPKPCDPADLLRIVSEVLDST